MGKYYLKSDIGNIAKGISELIDSKKINPGEKLILFGLDRNSFAMRTILSNMGFNHIECYLAEEKAQAIMINMDINNFACRYFNRTEDIINVTTVEDRLIPYDDNARILIASPSYDKIEKKLADLGYKANVHFFSVCDFIDEKLEKLIGGKTELCLEEIQSLEKNMLSFADEICRKHQLRYWVCGGTLLGTIRHKGFIPWDDDADIFLPWKDYQKFMEVFEETERYSLVGMGVSGTTDYCDVFAKIVDKRTICDKPEGTVKKISPLGLDIFPLIGLPEEEDERHLFFVRYRELCRSIWQDFYATNGDLNTFPCWFDRQRAFLEQYDFDESKYVGVLGTDYGERDCTLRDVYQTTLRMNFEDIMVNVPGGYQEYLTNLYGNWNQLPDESKRKPHNNMAVYWI